MPVVVLDLPRPGREHAPSPPRRGQLGYHWHQHSACQPQLGGPEPVLVVATSCCIGVVVHPGTLLGAQRASPQKLASVMALTKEKNATRVDTWIGPKIPVLASGLVGRGGSTV